MQDLNMLNLLGFTPKENTTDIYSKKYSNHNDYSIEVDFKNEKFFYGDLIRSESKTTQNFSQKENWVVLECVDRLLEKGYKPENIILEKVFPTGHGTSGRLDILVTRDDKTAYMMIECKTWGSEFEKEFKKLNKDGGQLFTYFQQDKSADVLVLYASKFENEKVLYTNQIIKIEEEYRQTSNVKDFFDRWNKIPKNNGVFESYSNPYEFISKALTKKDLQALQHEDSSFIFNRFLEILRHNVVSDKPNAFNKIFTLFLCKIIDEDRSDDEQLHFQWLEGEDNHISFQKRLTDLYNRGMKELLEKKVTDVSDSEFEKEFQQVDDDSFNENAIVVKEIVELLQTYQIRYNYRQQFLSDFFELLLTTGLKQESGQFFTPVPVARFIIKSIPIQEITKSKIEAGDKTDLLPAIIDYSAGSGHFITESMEEVQKYIDTVDESKLTPSVKKSIKSWKEDQFDWAEDYVYAIEKDYRLVKTAKVSCYLHGDGLAKVIHGDGLAAFESTKEYRDRLRETDKTYPQDNKQFDIIVSNPPYSVSAFKTMMNSEKADKNFELFEKLTDQSSEIEALFIERTKQLLKDGGIAGIILPGSILSNGGIYTGAREIIFKYFDIVSIVELGSNTFMATGTNTVVLFLKRRNNKDHENIKASVDKLFDGKKDITTNGIENPLSKYLSHVWEDLKIEDYLTLLEKEPNKIVKEHEIYKEYTNKIKEDSKQLEKIIDLEKEKLFYFILSYPQKVTVVKTGEKKEEKSFLGYEFSNRRGSEGIHPIQRGKTIDECTKLFDPNSYENPLKANSYIFSALQGEEKEIDEGLKDNISYVDLVDMMTFDRVDFEKNISLSIKKKLKIDTKWEIVKLGEQVEILDNKRVPLSQRDRKTGQYPYYGATGIIDYIDDFIFEEQLVLLGEDGAKWGANENSSFIVNGKYWVNNHAHVLKPYRSNLLDKYLVEILNQYDLSSYITGLNVPKLNQENLKNIKIPLPPKNIQKKIIEEIEELEQKESNNLENIEKNKTHILSLVQNINSSKTSSLVSIAEVIAGQSPKSEFYNETEEGLPFYQGKLEFTDKYISNPKIWTTKTTKESIKGDILMSVRAPVGDVNINPFDKICIGRGLCAIRTKGEVSQEFLFAYLRSIKKEIENSGNKGATFSAITKSQVENIKIPILSEKEEEEIIFQIEKFEKEIIKKEKELQNIPKEKEKILNKYLNIGLF